MQTTSNVIDKNWKALIKPNKLDITKSINKPGQYIGIMPAQSHSDWAKSSVFIRKRNKD